MTDKEIQTARWFGASVIIIFVMNMFAVHRRDDAINEFRAYFQGAMSCVSPGPAGVPQSPPLIRTFYEN